MWGCGLTEIIEGESSGSTAKVLVLGLDGPLFQRIEPLLSRTYFTLARLPGGEGGVHLSSRVAFDLIIVANPLSDMGFADFVGAIRQKDGLSARSSLLVLTEGGRVEEARRVLDKGSDLVLSVDEPWKLLEDVASRLLGVAPRIASRLLVRLDVRLQEARVLAMGQSENLSGTGMLVRTEGSYPLGTKVGFETLLPSDSTPIEGEAEVVHHAVAGAERIPGLGLKFRSFKGDGLARLRTFVAHIASPA